MPRTYIRKTDRVVIPADMKKAVDDVIINKLSFRKSAALHNVKKSTLKDNVDKTRKGHPFEVGTFNKRQVFSQQIENGLTDYLLSCSEMYYGLTPKSLRRLAYEYAKQNNMNMPETWEENKMAGKDLLAGFIHRNNTLSIRSPVATSLARMTSFNKVNVGKFQTKLAEVIGRHSFADSEIFNLEETGFTTVQRIPKVIAKKGIHQVRQVTSRERGELVTVVGKVCANGNALPPVFVFPRVRMDTARMMSGATDG